MITGMAETFPPAARAWTRDVGPTVQQPTGIIKCLPQKWLEERGGEPYLNRVIEKGVASGRLCFYMSMPVRPKLDVLHFYLNIAGRIRYRMNIIVYEKVDGRKRFTDGTSWLAAWWAVLGAPVVEPPHEYRLKGFRGFRYTEELW